MAIKTTGGLKTSWLSDAMYRMTGVGSKMAGETGDPIPEDDPRYDDYFNTISEDLGNTPPTWGPYDEGGRVKQQWGPIDERPIRYPLKSGQAICNTSILIGGVLSCLSALYFISCL